MKSWIKYNLNPIIICGIIYTANPPWFLWSIGQQISFILSIILFTNNYSRLKNIPSGAIMLFIFLLFPIFILLPYFRGWHLTSIIYSITFFAALMVPLADLKKSMNMITTILAIILIISFPIWLFHVYVYPLSPYSTIDLSSMKGVSSGIIMNNYILFVTYSGIDMLRFYSVFDEPGVLGTLAAFILYGNKYDLKRWQVSVILIGSIFTFSLAFYLLTIIGFSIIHIKQPKKLIISGIILFPALLYCFILLQDNLAFQLSIVNRLNSNTSELVESRNSDMVNYVYQQNSGTNKALFGIGDNEMKENGLWTGASYKHFILEYGWIGLISMLLLYIILMRKHYNLYTWGAYLLLFMSFMQRPAIWTNKQMLVFCCMIGGLTTLRSVKSKVLN